ncbi:hypothetical protein DNTS_009007 [Danionella cerebrum]|uniref:Activating transcription factor 7-interacting protein Fn3 domain-containing protein n=1 Tax=Danionella cerebrum TaxID=2873325 RepID=A0A553QAB5_9TELE|nr:hypothetical protein DNTS_009007 [Danionella translucida]
MKRSRYAEEPGNLRDSGEKASKLPRSEVEKIIDAKIRTAVEQSDFRMKNLLDRILEVNNELTYDVRIKKLEAHVKKIQRRGDAVFSYVRKLRASGNLGGSSTSPSVQSLRCISPLEAAVNTARMSANGGSVIDSTLVSSADMDLEIIGGRKPTKGFWHNLRSKKEVVDLTDEDRAEGSEVIFVSQPSQENLEPSSTPPVAVASGEEKQSASQEERVSSSVQLEEEGWQSKLHPFPDTPFPKELPLAAASHNLPQKAEVKLAWIGSAQELGIAWNVDRKDPHVAEMDSYHIYISHENKNGNFTPWKCIDVIKAMPLPMGCKVSGCKGDKRLCFVVVGKDIYGRFGPYSEVRAVAPGQS